MFNIRNKSPETIYMNSFQMLLSKAKLSCLPLPQWATVGTILLFILPFLFSLSLSFIHRTVKELNILLIG